MSKATKTKTEKASDENARPPLADAVVVSRGRKLDPGKVRQIRQSLADGLSCNELGALFSVHPSTIDDIKVRRTWASLD